MKRYLPLTLLTLLLLAGTQSRAQAPYERERDVIYRKKLGVACTFDVLRPPNANGAGVLWMVSGGWMSSHEAINPAMMRDFLKRGQTVFMVVHGTQPKFTMEEILADVDRSVRFIRRNAARWNVDPNRLGISGGSAGGHLSLMQGARGSAGKPDAPDPVDRESSRVQAVACFYPPTDLLNYGAEGESAWTLLERFLKPVFGPQADDRANHKKLARDASPIYLATSEMPPTLIIHGDQDKLVPIQQAEVMIRRLEELKTPSRLIVKPGAAHGWAGIENDVAHLAEWFDTYLKPDTAPAAAN